LSQLERYEKDENVELAVALGLCEASFVEDLGFPLITYRDILSILNGLPSRHSDFGVLVRHYQDYLERELELLDLIIECYAQGHGELRGQILESIETGPYTANDRRFLSLFLLESFRRSCLKDGPRWGGSAWETNKNDRSGVWMASRNGLPDAYEFATSLRELCQDRSAELWFHLELKDDAFSRENTSKRVGFIQLRCRTEEDNGQFMQGFKKLYEGRTEHRLRKKPSEQDKTFYVSESDLFEEALMFDKLEDQLFRFCESFGNFSLNDGLSR
jgi:hypothetical protein